MKKRFLLRVDPAIYEALEKWAADDLRSVNGQIEYLLAVALRQAGRLPAPTTARDGARGDGVDTPDGSVGGTPGGTGGARMCREPDTATDAAAREVRER